MGEGFPRLLGDIGGTHARWAWQGEAGGPLESFEVVRCAADGSLQASARAYLDRIQRPAPRWAGIGIATPVTGDRVRMTNNDWSFSIAELQRGLSLERCLVLNDFTALAMSLPALAPADLQSLGGGTAVADTPMALLGPGTGLGVSGLLPDGRGGWAPLAGEGGHVTLAATDDREAALLARLRSQLGHVSAERVLSGNGLVNLHRAQCELDGRVPRSLDAAAIVAGAAQGSEPDCVATVRQFSAFLGNVAGNLALTLGARGGVYLGGGIVPRLGAGFDSVLFRSRFADKGRFSDYLRTIPTSLIVAKAPALLGATRALDLLQA